MIVGIIGAMEIEVAEIKELMKDVSQVEISGITYYKGNIYGKDVVVAKSGVGKVHAAVCAQTMILKYAPSLIINTGVAGSLNTKLDIADLIISDFVVEHDMDTTGLGDPLGLISGLNIIKIPVSSKIVNKVKEAASIIEDTNIYVGTIATGDQFICDVEKKNYIVEKFDALCVEMEGAAIGHVCYLNKTDFCIVRSISDKADGSAHIDFPSFVKVAAKKSTELIHNYMKCL